MSVALVARIISTLAKTCQTGSLWIISDFFLHLTLAYKATGELMHMLSRGPVTTGLGSC